MELAERARTASRALLASSSEQRARALRLYADELESRHVAEAVAIANEADLRSATGKNAAFVDRLRIDEKRLAGLARAVREVAALPDPVGEVVERSTRPNGLQIQRVRAPLGVILMIYESRPGVTADAAALSGTVGVPDGPPVILGPVAPASATTGASHPRVSGGAAAASCGTAADEPCPADQLHSLSADSSTALATVERGAPPECTSAAGSTPAPPMAGACSQGVHVEMLTGDAARAVVADGVSSSSLTAGCPAAPTGRVSIGDLEIGGLHVAGGPGALVPTSTPEPNTAVALAPGTVVLNEQRPDRGGRGLTVNAVHIVIPASLLSPFSLDMVIGHSHSAATPRSSCAAAPAPAVTAPPAPARGLTAGAPEGLLPDDLQVRKVLRGVISL